MKLQTYHLIILSFCLLFFNSYSQSVAEIKGFGKFETSLTKSGLDTNTINKIKTLIETRNKNIAQFKKEQEEQNANYPITFQNPQATVKYNNQLLIKSLSNLISLEQFKKLFLPQLQSQIQRQANDKIFFFTEKYSFTSEQLSKLKKMCYQTTENEIIVREYYNYDDTISKDNYEEEKIRSAKNELELFESFGLLYSKDSKTDTLIKKLKELHIEQNQINKILTALQKRSERMANHDKVWRVNDTTSVIEFYDEGDSQFKFDMEVRQEVAKALKIEEFRTVFEPSFKERITRESQKEFNVTKTAYNLTEQQNKEIYNLITEKNTEKVITEEYYKFSYYLYEQKLRAVEYRHEKTIREAIQKMTQSSK
jgi:hypothetical protein